MRKQIDKQELLGDLRFEVGETLHIAYYLAENPDVSGEDFNDLCDCIRDAVITAHEKLGRIRKRLDLDGSFQKADMPERMLVEPSVAA